ncbi:MAG: helix-turn-helix transcriptional regulator [Clostridiales bacterium]|nr:helix-turn-helix transcriptional regulator [Clostridiales bacterium]
MQLSNYINEDINVKIAPYSSKLRSSYDGWIPPLHWHPHYEILMILSGYYTVINNSSIIKDTTPAVFIHRPYSIHKSYIVDGTHFLRYVVSFDISIAKQFPAGFVDLSHFTEASMTIVRPKGKDMRSMSEICNEMSDYTDDPIMRTLCAAKLIHLINRTCKSEGYQNCGESYNYIQDLLEYVSNRLSEQITLQDLSKQFNVSVTKLQNDFKESVGVNYKKHITALRQTHAHEMLKSGESIIKTSLECGYSSEAHFIKAFREYWGMTPGELLHKLQEFNKV